MAYRAYVLTASDAASRGEREDRSGPEAERILREAGYVIAGRAVLPDERELLAAKMREICDTVDLLVTTGGTGFSPRDYTPEAAADVTERPAPGIAEAMRAASLQITPRAMLSRGTAGIRGRTLIVNLPGSPKAVRECLEVVLPALGHGLDVLRGGVRNCGDGETGGKTAFSEAVCPGACTNAGESTDSCQNTVSRQNADSCQNTDSRQNVDSCQNTDSDENAVPDISTASGGKTEEKELPVRETADGPPGTPPAGEFTHFNPAGRAHMVDVSDKAPTVRTAAAAGQVRMNRDTLRLIRSGGMYKGDVLGTAQLAGIMAAKRTSDWIPLCHPLPLTGVDLDCQINEAECAVDITAIVRCTGPTGVEMEALAAVSAAALTVYDMCKAVQRDMEITSIRLLRKEGGQSGLWQRCP